MDDSELWIVDENGEGGSDDFTISDDPRLFKLELGLEGQAGGFHTRNRPGQKQRETITSFDKGPKRRSAFYVGCTAKVIIHGTLDEVSNVPATLLVYDFSFFSYRSARIKDASIHFEFQGVKQSGGPTVEKIAPYGKHVKNPTSQTAIRKIFAEAGIGAGAGPVNPEAKVGVEREVVKTTTHSTKFTGNSPADEWGNRFVAAWSLEENESQKNGIPTFFRACILLTRDTKEEEFQCIPTIKATPNFTTFVATIASSRPPDDPIVFDPGYEPYNTLGPQVDIDRWNLSAVPLAELWDCRLHNAFDEADDAKGLVN